MNKSAVALWIGIALLFASWMILPVRRVEVSGSVWSVKESRFRFILHPDPPEAVRPLDWSRLLLIDTAIVMVTVAILATLRRKED